MPSYQPIDLKSRKNSFRIDSISASGHDTPNSTLRSPAVIAKKFSSSGKYPDEMKNPVAVDDVEILEIRPDGMRETNLLTFSFYAPWIKISQIHASKKEANIIRLKVIQI